jgi:ceramide glucosyltransferase
MSVALVAAGLAAALAGTNLVSLALSARRLKPYERIPAHASEPSVSVVIPVRGVEAFSDETIARAFQLDYPFYELIFCMQDADDPVGPRIRRAIAAHPKINARLLVGDDAFSENPKLNNCVKGWDAARHPWVVLADSNVLMPPDYLQQLFAGWRPDTGLVCSTPIGSRPQNFWAEVECAFLNTLQARWQYTGEALGMGYAQGKSMLWYKPLLEAEGGIRALSAEIAEDAAATKLVRSAGRHVHLADSPFEQPLGVRSFREIWSRQIRWARLRRVTFPLMYAPEVFIGGLMPALAATVAAGSTGHNPAAAGAIMLAINYLPEVMLAASKGWHVSWSQPIAMLVRDILQPASWLRGWLPGEILWHGQSMNIRPKSSEDLESPTIA